MRETLLIQLPADDSEVYSWCAPGGSIETSTLAELKAAHTHARLIGLAPSEHVGLYRVNLAVRQSAKLLQAVPYALEDQLADDVDDQHFAITARQTDGSTPVAVVERAQMRSWLAPFEEIGLVLDSLLPEALALPLSDNMLSVLVQANGRCLVRRNEFDGFATHLSVLPALLSQDECEQTVFLLNQPGVHLPEQFSVGRSQPAVSALDAAVSPFQSLNLLQGEFAPKRATDQWLQMAKFPAALAAGCLLFSLINLALGNASKQAEYDDLQERALLQFSEGFPQITRIVDPKVQAEQALAKLKGGNSEDRFLSLLSQSAPILNKVNALKLDAINFREGALYLSLSGSDLQALEVLRAEFEPIQSLKLDVQSAQAGSDGVQIRLKVEQA